MKALRTLLVIAAAALMVTAGSTAAYAETPATDACATDGSADLGTNATSTDANTGAQVAATVNANEDNKANANKANDGQNTTDVANNQCGSGDTEGVNAQTQGNNLAAAGTNNPNDDGDKDE